MQKITHENKVVGYVHNETLVLNETAFNALAAEVRSAILVTNPAKNYDFRKDFSVILNVRSVLSRLKAGADVSAELAFHEVELPKDFAETSAKYHELIKKVETALDALKPSYPFVEDDGTPDLTLFGAQNRYISNGSYKCPVGTAKKLWGRAAAYWADYTLKPSSAYSDICGYSRHIVYREKQIEIGCQTISRSQIERLALQLNWDFPTE